jgi:hypothetical protein
MDFSNLLHGLGWPGEKLTHFDPAWHGETKWHGNARLRLGFGRCVKCHQIVAMHDPEHYRPVLVGVEFPTDQWLHLKARRA